MLLVIALLVFTTVSLATYAALSTLRPRPSSLRGRLAEIEQLGPFGGAGVPLDAQPARSGRFEKLLYALGASRSSLGRHAADTRRELAMAGFRRQDALTLYHGLRLLGAVLLPLGLALLGAAGRSQFLDSAPMLLASAGLGYFLPRYALKVKIRHRQDSLRRGLADALDLLVICVEAGLGLNQALARVAEEMVHTCRPLSEEFHLVNLEMRAGTPRADALRRLGERTGLDDLKSLVAVVVQTDRFGTGVAQSLRVHSDALRTQRRQRAEEAAAKTTIKLVFPLVFFIFPAMFVVVLGPAILHILEQLSGAVK